MRNPITFYLLSLFSLLFITSCGTDDEPDLIETGFFEQGFELLWETDLSTETDYTSYCILTENYLVAITNDTTSVFDHSSGELQNQYDLLFTEFDKRSQNHVILGDQLTMSPFQLIVQFNAQTGEIEISADNSFRGILAKFENEYVTASYNFQSKIASYHQAPIGSDSRIQIHEIIEEDYDFLSPHSPVLERNQAGEIIMYYLLDKGLFLNTSGYTTSQDNNFLVAYNLSRSELIWEKNIGMENSLSFTGPPIITPDALIYQNPTLFALDKFTGAPLWEIDETTILGWNGAKLSDGMLVVQDNKSAIGIDALTGAVRWRIPDMDKYSLEVKDGKVFLTNDVFSNDAGSKVILCANIMTGEILWQVKAPSASWGTDLHFQLHTTENIMYVIGRSKLWSIRYPE